MLAAGGSITRLNLHGLPRPGDGGPDAVVDCSGMGAKFLAADPAVHPVQGQVVLVEQVGLERWWLDERHAEGPTYVVPRSRDIVVGGTDVEGEWSRTPSPDVAAAILRRALRLVPALAGAEVIGHRVGLRPARPEVRLERVGDVVHCYGHGGAGVTLSWGCAARGRRAARLMGGWPIRDGHPPAGSLGRVSRSRVIAVVLAAFAVVAFAGLGMRGVSSATDPGSGDAHLAADEAPDWDADATQTASRRRSGPTSS